MKHHHPGRSFLQSAALPGQCAVKKATTIVPADNEQTGSLGLARLEMVFQGIN